MLDRRETAGNARAIYTQRVGEYAFFIRTVFYPQGLRAFFRGCALLRSGLRILDAGCGYGVSSLALLEALRERGLKAAPIDGFDLTPAMLDRFHEKLLHTVDHPPIRVAEANVLHLEQLPDDWRDYDLIVSSAMLEYLPRDRLADALRALRARLSANGAMLVFISRRNLLMKLLIERWWNANLYTANELMEVVGRAGLRVWFHRFPFLYSHLNLWGFIVEARPLGVE